MLVRDPKSAVPGACDEPTRRLPADCPRCKYRGVVALDDDSTIACPLCNNWCTLCLEDVPTFVQITRPYRGSLIAGMRPTTDGETLIEGYACDYHKAALRSYSDIAPAMVGHYQAGQAYLAAQGRSLSSAMALVRQQTGHIMRTRPKRSSLAIDTRPMARRSIPVQQSLLHRRYTADETFTVFRADKALRVERARTVGYNGSPLRMAGVHGHGGGALFGRAVRGGRVGEWRLADEGVAVILRDRSSAAASVLFTPHDGWLRQ